MLSICKLWEFFYSCELITFKSCNCSGFCFRSTWNILPVLSSTWKNFYILTVLLELIHIQQWSMDLELWDGVRRFSLSMPCVSVFFLTKLERERREKVVLSTFKLLPQTLSFCLFLNPLHPNVSMHILHTVLYKFPWVLTRRICSTILSFFWWRFPLFSRPFCVIWECYCREK